MHPDWEAIAAIGQIVGAGAVVLPLLFPGHQLRQNTRSVRGSSRARVTEILTSTIAEIQRGDFADALIEGFAGYRELGNRDQLRFASFIFECRE
jgi:hypothetical protein